MMNRWMKTAVIGVVVMQLGCNSYRHIYTSYDKGVDFSQYNTFAWVPDSAGQKPAPDEMGYDNDIIRNNAKNYINTIVTKRGMLVDIDSPDVLFELVLINEKKEKVITYHSYPPIGYYYYHSPYYFPYYYPYYRFYTWYGWNYPPFWNQEITTYTQKYVKGTVTINMYDREQQKLVWTGSAEGDIYDPAYIHMDVHPAIDRIMRKFPVRSQHNARPQVRPKVSPVVRTNAVDDPFRLLDTPHKIR